MTTRAVTRTRAVVVATFAALAVATAAASAAAAAPQPTPAPQAPPAAAPAAAGARLAACHRSPLIDERVATVGAWMRPLAGAPRLALRIDLQQRALVGGRWLRRTDVPGLGAWTTPSDALVGTRAGDVFKYRQAVGRLVVPAAYRFRVAFRWSDAAGAVVRETAVITRACRQPDLRPDLVLGSVGVEPRPNGRVRYSLLVSNEGVSAVLRATVAATLPGDAAPGGHVRSVGRLAPGASVVVTFVGAGCALGESPASFAADPSNLVEEVDEANNELAGTCPAP